jgi:hypothetical protein
MQYVTYLHKVFYTLFTFMRRLNMTICKRPSGILLGFAETLPSIPIAIYRRASSFSNVCPFHCTVYFFLIRVVDIECCFERELRDFPL